MSKISRTVELHISKSLSDSEWSILEAFCTKTSRLINTKILRSEESAIRGSIKYSSDGGIKYEATLPPEEEITEFLVAFRFFYQEKESTNFHKILGLLGKHAKEEPAREALKALKTKWANALFQTTLYISVNGEPITASLLLDLWFNAYYFHSDEEKSKKLTNLNEVFTEPFSKYMLLDATYSASKIIFTLYNGLNDLVTAHSKHA
ncbi:MAG: hypothetical protein ACXW1P_07245 [Methylophilaceae bacterium]